MPEWIIILVKVIFWFWIGYKGIMWIVATINTIIESDQVGFISFRMFKLNMNNEWNSFRFREYSEWLGGRLQHDTDDFTFIRFVFDKHGSDVGMIWDPIRYIIAVEVLKYYKRKKKIEQRKHKQKFKLFGLWSISDEAKKALVS